MDFQIQKISIEQQQLEIVNQQLKQRSQKYGSSFSPMDINQYKIFKIKRASQTGNIQFLDNVLLQQIENLEQRKQKIKKRIEAFYPELKVQQGDSNNNPYLEFFAAKEVPDFSDDTTQLRQNSWYLFGVDYMSNQLIRNYFNVNPNFRIEWINDSSCNITFTNKQQAEQAIKPHINGQSMKSQNDIWYELNDYEVDGVKRKLFARLATTKDVKKKEVKGHDSSYYKWVQNKQKLGNYVKKKAHYEMRKTKGINRENKFHQGLDEKKEERQEKRKKEEEGSSSSSGLDEQE